MRQSGTISQTNRAMRLAGLATLVIAALGIAWWALLRDELHSEDDHRKTISPTKSGLHSEVSPTPVQSTDNENDSEAPSLEEIPLSIESQEWYRARGYYFDLSGQTGVLQADHPYQAYDNETLEALVDGGDMVAATVLGDRLLVSNDPAEREKGLSVHEEAVVLGATYSAMVLAGEALHHEMSGDARKDIEKLEEGLAWYVFASNRGDAAANYSFRQFVQARNLSPVVVSAACERAKALRSRLAEERASRGLGEFDDSSFPQMDQLGKQGIRFLEPCK